MDWCTLYNCWCDYMDEEEYEDLGCDGKCEACDYSEKVVDGE